MPIRISQIPSYVFTSNPYIFFFVFAFFRELHKMLYAHYSTDPWTLPDKDPVFQVINITIVILISTGITSLFLYILYGTFDIFKPVNKLIEDVLTKMGLSEYIYPRTF
jgi:hypothetical protein